MPKRAKPAKKKDPVAEAAVDHFAVRSHNAWRRKLLEANPQQRGPRMRLRGGVMVDVNQPWEKLHPKAKADNRVAGYAAYEAVRKFPDDREAAAAYIHDAWIKRNKGDKSQPKALFKPYAQLPEVEKDKDRAHVDTMKKAIAAVRKRARATRAGRPSPRTSPPALKLSAPDLRRIEAARKELSQLLGREASAEAVVLAGAEAVVALCKAMSSEAKAKRD